MQTDERRLRFALHFIDMDFDALRPGDWLNLREDLQTFLRLSPPAVPLDGDEGRRPSTVGQLLGGPDPAHMTQEDIRGLQQTVRPWLRPRPVEGGYVTTFVLPQAEIAITGTTVHVRGKAEELFLDHVRCLLDKLPPLRVGQCEDCRQPFYARKAQRYCSRNCGNRVAQRNFRARVVATSVTPSVTIELQTTSGEGANADRVCTRGAGVVYH